jgi:hypothetical protein
LGNGEGNMMGIGGFVGDGKKLKRWRGKRRFLMAI